MFNIGDYVFNQKTGNLGKVIGYGHQIVDNAYMSTVKVLVDYATSSRKRGIVEEDLFTVWISWEEAQKMRFK